LALFILLVDLPAANATTLFSDTFQSKSDLNSWTSGGGEIVKAPDGSTALTFDRTYSGGDIFTNSSFTSSTGSFTISFEYLSNCGNSSNCGGFIFANGGSPSANSWILSDTPYYGIPNFADTGNWKQLSYTFAGNNTNLGLEIFSGSAFAAPGSIYFRDMALTDNNTGIPVGTLAITSAVPEAGEWAMMLLGLPLLGWVVRRKQAAMQIVTA